MKETSEHLTIFVIPVKTVIHNTAMVLDSRFRGNDNSDTLSFFQKFLRIISFIFIGVICQVSGLYAGEFLYGVKFGSNYGGPMPVNEIQGAWGTPRYGSNFSAILRYDVNQQFSIQPEVMLTFRGLDYGQNYKRDTVIDTFRVSKKKKVIPYQISTFYNATAKGEMTTNYIEFPVQVVYRPFAFLNINAGFFLSFLIGGKSEGKARVVVGEVTDVMPPIRDTTVTFNNFSDINEWDGGFIAGSSINLYKGFSLGFLVSRSIRTFYKTIIDRNHYYNTYFNFYMSYLFKF